MTHNVYIALALAALALAIGTYIGILIHRADRPTAAPAVGNHRPDTVRPVAEHWMPPVGAKAIALHVDTQIDMEAVR